MPKCLMNMNDTVKYAVLPPAAIAVGILLIHLFFGSDVHDMTGGINPLNDLLISLCYEEDALLFAIYYDDLTLLRGILTGSCPNDLASFWKSGTI